MTAILNNEIVFEIPARYGTIGYSGAESFWTKLEKQLFLVGAKIEPYGSYGFFKIAFRDQQHKHQLLKIINRTKNE